MEKFETGASRLLFLKIIFLILKYLIRFVFSPVEIFLFASKIP